MTIKIIHEKLPTNVAMPVPAIAMATTFYAFISNQTRDALTKYNRNENENGRPIKTENKRIQNRHVAS